MAAKDICARFLNRDPSKRLGSDNKGPAGIKAHPFFASIDWDKLVKREIPPPWAPKRSDDKTAAINFDDDFTSEDPTVSPPEVCRTRTDHPLVPSRQLLRTLHDPPSFHTHPSYLFFCGQASEMTDSSPHVCAR